MKDEQLPSTTEWEVDISIPSDDLDHWGSITCHVTGCTTADACAAAMRLINKLAFNDRGGSCTVNVKRG